MPTIELFCVIIKSKWLHMCKTVVLKPPYLWWTSHNNNVCEFNYNPLKQ
ncbi:17562_t:CDS:2, partial [Entrophospora sp. SA101]